MHWFKRRLLRTAREKPVKRKGSKSSNFSSLICYTDQKEESPQPTSLISSARPQLKRTRLSQERELGEEASDTLLHAQMTASPRRLHGMILAGSSLFTHRYLCARVYIYVRMYKTVSCSLPTRLDTVITTNSYVYVVRSHSMSVDLISHFTPQKIFNKSKRKKKKKKGGQSSALGL